MLRSLVAALTRAGRLAEAERIVVSVRNDNSEDNQDYLYYAIVAELIQMGCYTEARDVVRFIKSDQRQVEALGKLAAALSHVGDHRAGVVFIEAEEVADAIRDERRRAGAQKHLAGALVRSGRFRDALTKLGPQTMDEFVQTLADWSDYFETLKSGLFVEVLREATDVLGWGDPNWANYHESLSLGVICRCDH